MGIHMKNNINYTGATSLNTLRDVVIDSPATGQGLVYNEETQTWTNGNVASGDNDIEISTNTGDNPVGSIISYYGRAIPKPYLVCDGSEYNINDYPILAQHFEDNYGSVNYFGGDGETTFAVPSFESKTKVEEWIGYYIDEKYLYDGVGAIATYNGRTFYKNTEGLSIIVAVHGPGWTGGIILSTNPDMTCYSSYNTGEIVSPQTSFEYLGLTWYICQDPYSWAAVYNVSGLAPVIDITSSWDDYEVVGKEILDIVDLGYPEKLSLIKYKPISLSENSIYVDGTIKPWLYDSENEVIIGVYNGKPLYRKVLIGTLASATNTVIYSLPSEIRATDIFNIYGTTTDKYGNYVSLNGYCNSGYSSGFFWYEGSLLIYNGSDIQTGTYKVILEYTKTTDEEGSGDSLMPYGWTDAVISDILGGSS